MRQKVSLFKIEKMSFSEIVSLFWIEIKRLNWREPKQHREASHLSASVNQRSCSDENQQAMKRQRPVTIVCERGGVNRLATMPLEIMMEIASWLDSGSLQAMSRFMCEEMGIDREVRDEGSGKCAALHIPASCSEREANFLAALEILLQRKWQNLTYRCHLLKLKTIYNRAEVGYCRCVSEESNAEEILCVVTQTFVNPFYVPLIFIYTPLCERCQTAFSTSHRYNSFSLCQQCLNRMNARRLLPTPEPMEDFSWVNCATVKRLCGVGAKEKVEQWAERKGIAKNSDRRGTYYLYRDLKPYMLPQFPK
jgi:hypothetical protein